MPENTYVHGYSSRESERLADQARTLTELLHDDTHYPAGSRVLEAGCGIGAQTVILSKNSPGALITSIDISGDSLNRAQEKIRQEGITNVTFRQGDIFHLPFEPESFDHIFVCFITVIEGDHGSTFFHPDNADARQAIDCLVELQRRGGGNALIGRELFPLLTGAGFSDVRVSPRMVYVDSSRPALVEGFTKLTFTAMVGGVAEEVRKQGLMTPGAWERGIAGLYRTAEADGVFCYTFFKAVARK